MSVPHGRPACVPSPDACAAIPVGACGQSASHGGSDRSCCCPQKSCLCGAASARRFHPPWEHDTLIPPRLCRRKIAAVDPHIRCQQTAGVRDKGAVPGVVVPLWVNKETVLSLRIEDEQAVPGSLIVSDSIFVLCDEIIVSQQCADELWEPLGG